MSQKPKVNSASQQELDKVEKQFDAFDQNLKEMSLDRLNKAPVQETEPQTKLSQKDMEKSKDIYLKPKRVVPPGKGEKFNEDFREEYNFSKEYVPFIAENKEVIGETITTWTKPFPGMNAEEWDVPVNKLIYGPRYLAERIHGCNYHRFVMQQNTVNAADQIGQYFGSMAVDTKIQRLDALPGSTRKSIFMGAVNF